MDLSRRSPSHKGHMLAWLRCWETSQFGSKDGASGVPSNNRCQQHLSDIYGRDSTGMADQKKIKQKKKVKNIGKNTPPQLQRTSSHRVAQLQVLFMYPGSVLFPPHSGMHLPESFSAESDSSELSFSTWQGSDSDVNTWFVLLDPFSLHITGIADGKLS